MDSFNGTLTTFRQFAVEVRKGPMTLPDRNLDTGKATMEGGYRMEDKAYSELLEKLGDQKVAVPDDLHKLLVAHYANSSKDLSEKALKELELLRSPTAPVQ